MKFAKELEEDLVPEWRIKYLDYKTGKKKVKSVARALAKVRAAPSIANGTPRSVFSRPRNSPAFGLNSNAATPRTPAARARNYGTAVQSQQSPYQQRRSHRQIEPGSKNNEEETITVIAEESGSSSRDAGEAPRSDGENVEGGKTGERAGDAGNRSTPSALQADRRTHNESEQMHRFSYDGTGPQPLTLGEPALPDPSLSAPRGSRNTSASTRHRGHSRENSDEALMQRQRRRSDPIGVTLSQQSRIHFDSSHEQRSARNRHAANPEMTPAFSARSNTYSLAANSLERRDRPLIRRLWSETLQRRHRLPFRRQSQASVNGSTIGSVQNDQYFNAVRDLEEKEEEFFKWLESELDMVEKFYRAKEEEAVERLEVLKAQLDRMRFLRSREVEKSRLKKKQAIEEAKRLRETEEAGGNKSPEQRVDTDGVSTMQWIDDAGRAISRTITRAQAYTAEDPQTQQKPWYAPIERRLGIGTYRFGENTEALTRMKPGGYGYEEGDNNNEENEEDGEDSGDSDSDSSHARNRTESTDATSHGQSSSSSSHAVQYESITGDRDHRETMSGIRNDPRRDYVRKARRDEKVGYDTAKRQLKLALQEYYRGLELLKSYVLLNRTAFRKMNKKFDKAVGARPTLQFFSDKVNDSAYFVQSGVLDQAMVATEDLYSRFFARGNRKVAVGKLRSRHRRGHTEGSAFRTGLEFAAGTVLGIEGLVYGAQLVVDPTADPLRQAQAGYLLQIYAGYFLALILFIGFVIDAGVFTASKINYVFIFEFDTRHNLDWRQLAEIPCLLYFLFGLFFFLNFFPGTPPDFFLYWPVLLVGLSLLIIVNPLPIMYRRSRVWFEVSILRLLTSGGLPVEFRDFFLGDMLCSLTYAMGNIEVFFCMYAQHGQDLAICNSSHSRLLGFLSTLPGLFRAGQCIRRYVDTQDMFPHIANCAKYICTVLFYMTLSLYRIDRENHYFVVFVLFATINALYVSIWDLFMDWSLGDVHAPHWGLRQELAYKHVSFYYIAAILDPILRFNWIFYAIFRNEIQHSAILSFFVALSEVFRRIIWVLLRVENEHCTNVGRFRASRDVTLPYTLPPKFNRKHSVVSAATPQNGSPKILPGTQTDGRNGKQRQTSASVIPDLNGAPVRRLHSGSFSGVANTSAIDVENGINTGVLGPQLFRRRTGSSSRSEAVPSSPLHRGLQRVGTAISMAHAQDFERRRRPEPSRGSSSASSHDRATAAAKDDRDIASGRIPTDSEDEDDLASTTEDEDDIIGGDVEREMEEDEEALEAVEEEEQAEREEQEAMQKQKSQE